MGISFLTVHRRPGARHQGLLRIHGSVLPVAIGRNAIHPDKREGDGASPAGQWRILALLYRPDHGPRPATRLPCRAIRPRDGWCDDPAHRCYNRPVRLPFAGAHEKMWREDGLYDLVLVLDHNMRPTVPGRGSAIFMHIARPRLAATEGCVALRREDMRRLVARLSPCTRITILPG